MDVWSTSRGLDPRQLDVYEQRGDRELYLILRLCGAVPDVLLGGFWLSRLALQDGSVCCLEEAEARRGHSVNPTPV